MRRSIGEHIVSWVLDTTGAPPWRLYTQTDGQDRGVCVVAWGLRRSTVLAGGGGGGWGAVRYCAVALLELVWC